MTEPARAAFVDLHSHSTASDGARAPAAVVREAHRVGLGAIALTDHDTVDGVAEARRAGEELGVRVVTGVELSAVEPSGETHILGLHLADTTELEARLHALRSMRHGRAERIVARLNELGVRITLDDVLAQASGGAVGRPHVARAMVGAGWATDLRDAFSRYLGDGRAAFVPKEQLPLSEAVAMIHRAGGLAIVAHPAGAGRRDRIEALVALGVDGVEVRHPSHSPADTTRLMALADHFQLVPSGGSDWHGLPEGGRVLGAMQVPAEWLERQDARVARRAASEDESRAVIGRSAP
ncbi:MAG TPA: PHP domain-containing protein [Gemmatimonadaceae bacterium]|nr:PHP domain-containing protein [Gemmatimonadaceae bacterium]